MTAPGPSGAASLDMLRRDDEAWDAWVSSSATPTYLQVTAWALAKAPSGWRSVRVVADGGSGPIGAQILIRRLGPGPFSLGYAARGPIATRFDAASLEAFSRALRRTARREKLTHVTSDPPQDEGAARLFRAGGWRRAEPEQYEITQMIDVDRPQADLWAELRQTTRRYIERARREGATVREGSAADFDAFYEILAETARRGGFVHRSVDSYRQVYDAFSSTGKSRLLFADLADGTPAAVKLMVAAGGRWAQPYSGMTEAGGQSRANYLLEWETIARLAESGAREYDMAGLATPGIAYFKKGFGGHEVRYCGTWDLVTMPFLRDGIRLARRGWVRMARRRHGLDPLVSAAAVEEPPTEGIRT